MLITLDPKDPRPLYTQIVDEVRRSMALGILEPDMPLPSVRQLAVTLRINPNTVAQAYRELERLGLAYVRRGQGTFASSLVAPDEERESLASAVAARALQDAYRNGVTADELVDAIRIQAELRSAEETA